MRNNENFWVGLSGGPKPKKWNASLGPGALRNAGGVDYYAFGVARNGPKLVMVKKIGPILRKLHLFSSLYHKGNVHVHKFFCESPEFAIFHVLQIGKPFHRSGPATVSERCSNVGIYCQFPTYLIHACTVESHDRSMC